MSKICQKVTCWTPSVSLSFSLFFLSFVLCKNHLENGKEILRGSQGGQCGRSEGDSLEESGAGCALERNGGWTAIRGACENGHDSIVSILLAHPDIDVTQNDSDGRSVFNYVCASGKTCARQLLMDVRVKVNEQDSDGRTPLWYAARRGHIEAIKWWIASGRKMDLGTPEDIDKTDAIGVAVQEGNSEVVTLLERFRRGAAKMKWRVREELGVTCQSLFSISTQTNLL